ncbi:NfeD family protein [Treponema parvum]|uniref:NfeD family protein n=1 Tax=Treponema parvum TaxID=138851 RepID=UPI001AEBE092|nr:NfeD family protein [Treponema parvum]QTQ15443.1 NfeD family protein [Treponema parvum]
MPLLVLNNLPWFWLIIVILCIVIESLTMALTTIWFACGAFAMIFLSLAPLPFKWQLFIFVVISLLLLVFTRPLAAKKFAKKTPTNADRLIGKKTFTVQRITEFEKGAVKVGDVVWTARSENGDTIEKGAECKIVRLEGNTAVVKKIGGKT